MGAGALREASLDAAAVDMEQCNTPHFHLAKL